MSLLSILGVVAAGSGVLLGALLLVCLGPSRLALPLRYPDAFKRRLRRIAPYVAVLAVVLGVNKGLHSYSVAMSWLIGYNMTGAFYAIEGKFVVGVQQLFPSEALFYFAFIYVFGYVVLLVFPMVAYLFNETLHELKVLLLAYAANYGIGVVFYTLVVAYGPRNVMPRVVSEPMYQTFPEAMLLTAWVNTNTNVFPSLHTSLSVTAMVMAVMTHRSIPRWTPIAITLGLSVVVSTMYLGIHWLTDVIAGVALGIGAVYLAEYAVERIERSPQFAPSGTQSVSSHSD